jgi:hypothetical protein
MENILNVKDFGASGNGVDNDTEAIKEALKTMEENGDDKIYFPKGDYIVDYDVEFKNFVGEGTITFNGMVIEPFKSHSQGKKIKIKDLHDEVNMAMQVPNEVGCIEKIDKRKRNCGAWQLDDFSFKSYKYTSRQRVNTWGVVRVCDINKVPDKATFKIGHMHTLGYIKSLQKWVMLGTSRVAGGYWARGNNYVGNLDIKFDKFGNGLVEYDKETRGELGLHFWGDVIHVKEKCQYKWDDIQNVVCVYDISVTSSTGSVEGAWFGYSGGDAKHDDSSRNYLDDENSILEMCSGRAKFLHNYPVRLYSNTLDYPSSMEYCSQELIDNIIGETVHNKQVVNYSVDFNTLIIEGDYNVCATNCVHSPRSTGYNIGVLNVKTIDGYIIQEFTENKNNEKITIFKRMYIQYHGWTSWCTIPKIYERPKMGSKCTDLDSCIELTNKIAQGLADLYILQFGE